MLEQILSVCVPIRRLLNFAYVGSACVPQNTGYNMWKYVYWILIYFTNWLNSLK